MISETLLVWLGTMALLVDYAGISKADNDISRAIAFVISLLLWLAFTMNSLGYQVYSGGTGFETSAQSLALIGLIASVVTLVLLVDSGFQAIKDAFNR